MINHDLSKKIDGCKEKIDGCKNNPENSSKTNAGKHILSGFSMPTISSFKRIENKHDV